MKKRGKTLKYLSVFLLAFGIVFLFNIPKAFAGTAHQFSFEFYDCGGIVEADLTDTVNPDTNRVTTPAQVTCTGTNAKINPTTVTGEGSVIKLEKGKVVGVGIHYKPGSVSDYGMQFKYSYDTDSFEPLFFQIYDRKTKTYSQELAYTLDTDFKELYNRWEMFANISNTRPDVLTFITNDSRGLDGDYLEDELNIVYTYFLVKEDATVNTGLDFTWDNTYGTGVAMNNTEPVSLTNAKGYIEVPLSEDNTLGTLSVTSGSTEYILDPEFTPGDENTDSYTVVIPNNITSVNISATANDAPRAVLSGDTGNHTGLDVGNNEFTLTVLSEAGVPKDYTVNVYRLNNVATLSALNLTNVDFGTFVSGTTSYTATVPYTTGSTNVSATPTPNSKATIASGTGNKNLNVGSNPVSVVVNAENCKSEYNGVPGNTCTSNTYTVTVTRANPSTISTLNDLTTDGTTVNGFQSGDPTKSYDDGVVGYDKANVLIDYTKGEDHQSVTGDGTIPLNEGNNSLPVVVTAQDGTTKTTYTINIYKKSSDAKLSSLTATAATGGSINFSPNTTNYTYNVGADENEVTITATPNHQNATYKIYDANNQEITNGKVNPQTSGSVKVTVTPEDTNAATKDYVITFNIAKSTNVDLSDLTLNGTTITGFAGDKALYEIDVDKDTDSVLIAAELADDRASFDSTINDQGAQVLDYGVNEFKIKVNPEDTTAESRTYTIKITRAFKTDAEFVNIKVDTVDVPGFDPNDESGTHYDLGAVANNKDSVVIEVEKHDSDATVSGDGEQYLDVGDNSLPVTITAQDGTTTKTYYIDIRRQSNANDLAALTITSDPAGTWSQPFDPSITGYTYTTGPDVTEVTISATTPVGSGAVVVSGEGTYNPAETDSVTIRVEAEDGTPQEYIINLVRTESSNANLDLLQVEGYDAFDLTGGADHFTLTVPSTTSKVNIIAHAADAPRASLTGDGEKSVDFGDNPFTITVTPENPDAPSKVYYLTITRALKNNARFSDLTSDGVTVPEFDPDDPDNKVYDLGTLTDNNKTKILIGASAEDEDVVSITGTGNLDVNYGDNIYPVTITAQDGTTTLTYKVKVRKPLADSTLTGIEIQADTTGSLDKPFAPGETDYVYTSDPDEDEITIVVTPAEGATATIVGHPDGKVNPQDGPEDIVIMVQAENGDITNYTITVQRGLSANANLDSLEVEGYDPFDLTTGEDHFTLEVGEEVDEVNIIAHAEDSERVKSIEGDGIQTVNYGSNPYTVTVTAENDEPKYYYITINRALSSNVTLSDLKVEGETIDGFDPNDPSYDYGTVGNDVTSLDVEAIAAGADDGATVTVEGNDPLEVGENTITITVTAPDGETHGTYTITVTREANADNTLLSLQVEGFDPFDLSEGADHFEITIPNAQDSVNVIAVMNAPDTSTITGDGLHENLEVGENTIPVTVTAENDVPKTYTIVVTRESAEEPDELITSSIRTIADGYIKDVVYKSIPEQLKTDCDNENWKLHIFKTENEQEVEVSEDQKLGTGMIIKLIKNDRVNDSDILVVKGEITGDGLIKVGDIVAVVNNYLDADASPLEGAYFLAADMDDNGTIKVGDIVAIVNKYLED